MIECLGDLTNFKFAVNFDFQRKVVVLLGILFQKKEGMCFLEVLAGDCVG